MSLGGSSILSVGGDGDIESAPPALTLSQIVSGLLATNYYWGPGQFTYSIPGAGSTWAAYPGGHEPYSTYSTLSTAQANQFRAALAAWDQLIAPNFTETNDLSATGNIRVAFTSYDMANSWGYAYYPGYQGQPSAIASDIWINSDYTASTFSLGSYDFQALLHELGHTLGLKHTFEAPVIPVAYDTTRYSVMSYTFQVDSIHYAFTSTAGGLSASGSYVNDTTPMVLDIAAIQALYGADPNTAAGNTTYTFSQASDSLQSIYDAGGIDTLDLSNFTRSNAIDLRPGAYSSLGIWTVAEQISYWQGVYPGFNSFIANWVNQPDAYTWHDNLGIAYSTVIENAVGGSAADTILGNDVANRLSGGGGADVLDGGLGNDILDGGTGSDQLIGGAGSDTVSMASATAPVQIYLDSQLTWDGTSQDSLSSIENAIGSSFSDLLVGDAGANVLDGGAGGSDSILGGGGLDTVSYASSTHAVQIYLDSQLSWDGSNQDFLSSIENATGSSFNDLLVGDAGNNVLDGGAGGGDSLLGGAGSDTASYASSTHAVQIYLDSQLTWDGTNQDFLSSIENATGSAFNDLLVGDGGNNVLDGGAGGSDSLLGGAGSDTVSYASSAGPVQIYLDIQRSWDGTNQDFLSSIENATGSAFNDLLVGDGSANVLDGGAGGGDTILGGGGSDTVSYASSTGPVQIYLDSQLTWDGTNQDFLSSIENATGSSFNDLLVGDSGNNVLDGGAGGVDSILGGAGSDTVSYASSLRSVAVYLGSQVSWDGVSQDFLSSIENATGSNFADFLQGSSGNNVLRGGGGDDVIDGGSGGFDVLVLSGVLSDYTFTKTGADTYTVTDHVSGRDGFDIFSAIDQILFGDGSTVLTPDLIV